MAEPDVIIQALTTIQDLVITGIIGIGSLGAALLGLMWKEIRKLRSVRHDDRDTLTEIKSEVHLLTFNLEEYKKDQSDLHIKQHEDYSRLKWLIEEMNKND